MGHLAHLTRKGMTLIELMIVVTILAILAAIVIPTVSNAREQSAVNSTAVTLREFAQAYQRYHIDHQSWPGNPSGQNVISPDLEGYFHHAGQQVETPIGGRWISRSINGPKQTVGGVSYQQAPVLKKGDADFYAAIDAVLDDGDVETGVVQQDENWGPNLLWLVE